MSNTLPDYRTLPVYDSLDAFTNWLVSQPGFLVPPSPAEGVHYAGVFTGLTLYRCGRFQAQLWLCPPGSEIPDHSHPGVDIIQFYVCGQVYIRVNGAILIKNGDVQSTPEGLSSRNGRMVRIRDGDVHGATIGPQGGAFITVQEWKNGKPESVETAWEGEPLDEAHGRMLNK